MARSQFFVVRVTVLAGVLLLVLMYAWRDYHLRHVRNDWQSPLHVGVVIVEAPGGRPAPPAGALTRFAARISDLGDRLSAEFERYRDADVPMVEMLAYGPVAVERDPPQLEGEGLWYAVKHGVELWLYVSEVDSAANVPSRGLDSRIYVLVEPVRNRERKVVEGFSQQGGHIGVARVQLDESTVDFGLFVVAHELMHTLGATDRYDARGLTRIPDGLGDPAQLPLYPQKRAEVMARNRVLAPGNEVPPDRLEELAVGPLTAAEIGWVK